MREPYHIRPSLLIVKLAGWRIDVPALSLNNVQLSLSFTTQQSYSRPNTTSIKTSVKQFVSSLLPTTKSNTTNFHNGRHQVRCPAPPLQTCPSILPRASLTLITPGIPSTRPLSLFRVPRLEPLSNPTRVRLLYLALTSYPSLTPPTEIAKGNTNASYTTRATAAKDALGDKVDQKKHDVSHPSLTLDGK